RRPRHHPDSLDASIKALWIRVGRNSTMNHVKDNSGTARIRAAVEAQPRKMTLQLAHELGVPEVEVVRAFPSERVTELDVGQWEKLLRSFEGLGIVRVIVSNSCTTAELEGQFGGFSRTGPFFNVQTASLD